MNWLLAAPALILGLWLAGAYAWAFWQTRRSFYWVFSAMMLVLVWLAFRLATGLPRASLPFVIPTIYFVPHFGLHLWDVANVQGYRHGRDLLLFRQLDFSAAKVFRRTPTNRRIEYVALAIAALSLAMLVLQYV